jgi:hypothetical protein
MRSNSNFPELRKKTKSALVSPESWNLDSSGGAAPDEEEQRQGILFC